MNNNKIILENDKEAGTLVCVFSFDLVARLFCQEFRELAHDLRH